MVVEGDQVVVGDTHPAADSFWVDDRPAVIAYEVLCRLHHRHRMTRLSAQAARAEPLPFERGDDPFG
jgi:thymidine kinase